MKQTIGESEFIQAFDDMNRGDNFSYEGRRALFDYLEDIDKDMELDVIALCCEFSEYEDVEEYIKEYGTDIQKEEYDDQDEYYEAVKEEIKGKTTFIDIDGEAFIIDN